MKNSVTFDFSLPAFVKILSACLPTTTIEEGCVLRDASGHLNFIASRPLDVKIVTELNKSLWRDMSHYCRENCILDIEYPGARRIIESARSFSEVVRTLNRNTKIEFSIRLIDRRIVGQDWLTQPSAGWQAPQ